MRNLPVLLVSLAAAGVIVGSCTVDAAVETDRTGRVVGIEAVRLASTLKRLTVAIAVDGGGPVLELLWKRASRPSLAEGAGFEPAEGV